MKNSTLRSPEAIQAYMENQMGSGTKERCLRLLIALAVAAVCFACALFLSKLYGVNIDNYFVSLIVSGLYDDVGQCQFIHPLLSRALRGLSLLLPGADAFMLSGHVLVFLELFWLTDLLLREKRGPLLTAGICLLLLLASVGLKLFNCNFTIQAAAFAAAGMLTLSYVQRRGGTRFDILVGTFFFAVGFMWRRNAALLAIPYILLEAAISILSADDRRSACKKTCRTLVPCLLLSSLLLLTDAAMNADEAHQAAGEYNTYRVKIVDYPVREWEEISDLAEGKFSETDYYAARNWLFFDTERLNIERLGKIAALGVTTEFPFTLRGVLDAARSMKAILIKQRMCILVSVLALLALVTLPICRRLEIVLCGIGTLTILLYFVMLGHIPAQLWHAVLFFPLSLVLFDLVMEEKGGKKRSAIRACGLLLCALCALALQTRELELTEPQFAFNARRGADESAYAELLENDAVYVWAGTAGMYWQVDPVMQQGKLVSENFLSHIISGGDCSYGQVFFTSHLDSLGIPNPAAALVERDDVFLIADRPALALAILEQRAGGPVKAVPVSTISWFTVYEISAEP